MDHAATFLRELESIARACLPSLIEFQVRPGQGRIHFACAHAEDFVAAVMASDGANIRVTVAADFSIGGRQTWPMQACIVILSIAADCVDERLAYFLYELLLMRGERLLGADQTERLRTRVDRHCALLFPAEPQPDAD